MLQAKFLFSILLSGIILSVLGQEKNFNSEPSVSCEELNSSFGSLSEALTQITQSQFRFTESFKIRRKNGLKSGDFYSCDNEKGYLIIHIDDKFEIYREVIIKDWQDLISSNDPDNLIESLIATKYIRI